MHQAGGGRLDEVATDRCIDDDTDAARSIPVCSMTFSAAMVAASLGIALAHQHRDLIPADPGAFRRHSQPLIVFFALKISGWDSIGRF